MLTGVYNYHRILFLLLTSLYVTAVGQDRVITTLTLNLPKNVNWKWVMGDGDLHFVAGVHGENVHLFSLEDKSTTRILMDEKKDFVFLSKGEIYLAPLGKLDKADSIKNRVLVFDYKGILKRRQYFNNAEYIVGFSYSKYSGEIFFSNIHLDDFMRTGHNVRAIKTNIVTLRRASPIISLTHRQPPPPLKLALPVIHVDSLIYIAFQDEYLINVYTLKGERVRSFTNDIFEPHPYTDEEVSFLSDMERTYAKPGVHYPMIIRKIQTVDDRKIVVARFQRPGSRELIIDIFDEQAKLSTTINLEIHPDDTLLDMYAAKANYFYCLVYNKNQDRYAVYAYLI